MTPETYLGVHLLFVLPPMLLVAVLAYTRGAATWGRLPFVGTAVVVALAVVYTFPWDNHLIERDVWWYGDGVTAATLGAVPLGEFLFFLLQPVLVALWLYNLEIPTDGSLRLSRRTRLVGLLAGVAVGGLGVGLLLAGPSTLYLGAILAWGAPILAVQWAFGWPHLLYARRTVALGIGVPTVYLWVVDWYAVTNGLWTISSAYTVGIAPFGLPIEEMVFFLMTNAFIVQGLVLYLWLVKQWPTVEADVRAAVPPALAASLPTCERVVATDSEPDDRGRRS